MNLDWYGHTGIRIRTFWQVVISIVVLVAAIGVGQAKSDVKDLLDRQAKDDRARAAAVAQGKAARKQQCEVTPVFVKALDFERLSARERVLLDTAIERGLKGCPK